MKYAGLSILIISTLVLSKSVYGQDSTLSPEKKKINMLGILHDVAFFPVSSNTAAHLTSMEYSSKNKVPLSLRLNIAHRFNSTGLQMEADAYPVINKKTYAYTNLGLAVDALFPKYRAGLSVFRALPKAFEAEGGFRFLYFKSPVWIYTASIGKYHKSFWFNLSTFLTPTSDHLLQSYFGKARYYFNEKSYTTLTLGTGISPDDRRNNNQFGEVSMLRAKRADIHFRLSVKKTHIVSFGAGVMRQRGNFETQTTQFNTTAGYYKLF